MDKDCLEKYCNFYQTGYCKFKEKCCKKHEHEICKSSDNCTEKDCIKIHPKLCKYFSKYGKCIHNNNCAYKHTENVNDQIKVLEAMMLLVLKQQEELESLKEEVNVLKSSVQILIKTKEDKNQ